MGIESRWLSELALSVVVVFALGAGSTEPTKAQAATGTSSPSTYDGNYVGTMRFLQNLNPPNNPCQSNGTGIFDKSIQISNGQFQFMYNTQYGPMSGNVRSDGVMTASQTSFNGAIQMTARIQGAGLQGEVRSPVCLYTLELKKQ